MRSKSQHRHDRSDLVRIADQAMAERGLEAEFSDKVKAELAHITGPGADDDPLIQDLTGLLWCSIDNDDSRDLDQLSVAQALPDNGIRIRVAIADVDALVKKGSAIDQHAMTNTTSVYTSARIYPMLPELLCTNYTSLNPGQTRLALVTEMDFLADGSLQRSGVYRARVYNHAQLCYDAIADWLEGTIPLPKAAALPGLDAQLIMQDALAQKLRTLRYATGALEFESVQPRLTFEGEAVKSIDVQPHNRARQLIEELMIATNTCTAKYLKAHQGASIRRVVRSPERWALIVAEAEKYGETLPYEADATALEAFLARRRAADPLRFPDLSLVIIKLMGSGEYVVEGGHAHPLGHFALSLRDYTHSTAPNRRYPDLITSRMVKAALAGQRSPYTGAELSALALHCTKQEDASRKVERRLRKSEAALVLETRLGQRFNGVVTGTTFDGGWVRIIDPPVEGRLHALDHTLALGERVKVELVSVNVERGFIDFEWTGNL